MCLVVCSQGPTQFMCVAYASQTARKNNRRSPYFLDFYGRFMGADLHGKYREPGELKFNPEENYNSIIVLTLDAKDIALIYNR